MRALEYPFDRELIQTKRRKTIDVVEQQKAKGKNEVIYPVSENDWFDMGQFSEIESIRKCLYGEW